MHRPIPFGRAAVDLRAERPIMILAAQGRGLCARGRFGIRGRPACLCGACTRVCARPAPLAPAYLSNPAIPRRRHPSKHGESTAPFRSGAPRPLQVPRSILNSSVVPRPLPGRCLPLPFRKSIASEAGPLHCYSSRCFENSSSQGPFDSLAGGPTIFSESKTQSK